jgi:tetratricopeptide (TPR) repeat protein
VLHGAVARIVAEQVQVALSDEQEQRLQETRPVDPEAYRLVALGTRQWNDGSPTGLEESVESYRQALALEPDYVEALAGLANAYAGLGCQGLRHPSAVYPEARRILNRALAMDPDNPEALAALAHMTWECDWDFEEAVRLLHEALDENPSYAFARHLLGFMLFQIGRPEEGLRELERAYALDPFSPRLSADLGWLYINAGEVARGERQLEWTRNEFPEWNDINLRIREARLAGDLDRAIALTDEFEPPHGAKYRLAARCGMYVAKGDTASARAALAALVAMADTSYVSPASIAMRYNRLGDVDQAVAWLERALEIRDPRLARFREMLDHEDPRVVAIGRRVGFE